MLRCMIFESSCAGCGSRGPVLCRVCRFALVAPAGLPVRHHSTDVIAAIAFAGRGRDVLLGFKYGNRRQLAHHLAGLLTRRLLKEGLEPGDFDVVTWAPTSRAHRRHRGFDQAEVVARRVALQLGLPCRRMLEREGNLAQTGRARADRLHGPVFRAAPSAAGRRVLVVDDVVTTGSTLRSAADALRAAGAASVQRAAVATTPALAAPAARTRQAARPTHLTVVGRAA